MKWPPKFEKLSNSKTRFSSGRKKEKNGGEEEMDCDVYKAYQAEAKGLSRWLPRFANHRKKGCSSLNYLDFVLHSIIGGISCLIVWRNLWAIPNLSRFVDWLLICDCWLVKRIIHLTEIMLWFGFHVWLIIEYHWAFTFGFWILEVFHEEMLKMIWVFVQIWSLFAWIALFCII